MDFSEEYRQKLVSADEAVKVIKSGDWVDYGWCTNTVDALDKALAKRTDELKDINLRGGILLKPLAVFEREDAGEHFTWNSWHMSGIERHMIARGCAHSDSARAVHRAGLPLPDATHHPASYGTAGKPPPDYSAW